MQLSKFSIVFSKKQIPRAHLYMEDQGANRRVIVWRGDRIESAFILIQRSETSLLSRNEALAISFVTDHAAHLDLLLFLVALWGLALFL